MKHQSRELIGPALDWVVADIEYMMRQSRGEHVKQWVLDEHKAGRAVEPYSTDWNWGGELIDREKIELYYSHDQHFWKGLINTTGTDTAVDISCSAKGPNALVAAMRSYVIRHLGEEVEVPSIAPRDKHGRPMVCSCCGTIENLHADLGSGGPYRCSSPDCVVY